MPGRRRNQTPAASLDVAAPAHRLHIVTGKGGTGKTTVAAALALALAGPGRRILLCEVEDRQGIARTFGQGDLAGSEERLLATTEAGGQVFGLSINARDALTEYLAMFYKVGMASRALDRFGFYDFATSIAPGLRDVLLTGKVYEAVRRRAKKLPNSYDAVVLDAPPTGRITRFLNVHDSVSGLAKVGPIHSQAASVSAMLRADSTVVHITTLLQEMPVTETIEAIADLQPTGISVGTIVCNAVTPTPLTAPQFDLVAQPDWDLDVPGLAGGTVTALRREFADELAGLHAEQESYETLLATGRDLAELPFQPQGVQPGTLTTLADLLSAQLPAEVAP